ncbi:hypothetical protein HK102_013979 [Quaeritorhiza haematococci]|nr:hypothetical protein HK102_013979 [Quaeritorhiza haematococci]
MVKAVLFTCYNILSGIIVGLVALALDGLSREGQMVLLMLALATSSLGISTTIVGSRIYYALLDRKETEQRTYGSLSRDNRLGTSKSIGGTPKINSNAQNTVPSSAEDSNRAQADLTVFKVAVRQQRTWFMSSSWFPGIIMVGKIDRTSRPTVHISLWKDDVSGGQEARRPTQSMILTLGQIGQVFAVADTGNTVRIECSRGICDLDFPTDAKATQFVEVFQSQMMQGNEGVI